VAQSFYPVSLWECAPTPLAVKASSPIGNASIFYTSRGAFAIPLILLIYPEGRLFWRGKLHPKWYGIATPIRALVP